MALFSLRTTNLAIISVSVYLHGRTSLYRFFLLFFGSFPMRVSFGSASYTLKSCEARHIHIKSNHHVLIGVYPSSGMVARWQLNYFTCQTVLLVTWKAFKNLPYKGLRPMLFNPSSGMVALYGKLLYVTLWLTNMTVFLNHRKLIPRSRRFLYARSLLQKSELFQVTFLISISFCP